METKRVLIVNDEPSLGIVLKRSINEYFNSLDGKKYNLVCDYSQDALSALEMETFSYSVIIVDLLMPFMDGSEYISKLREMNYKGKIFLITAHEINHKTVIDLIEKFNIDFTIHVPFDFIEIYDVLIGMLQIKEDFYTTNQMKYIPSK